MPGSPLQPQAGVLLFFGFVVGLGKIHQGYCLRPSASPKTKIPPAIPEINFENHSNPSARLLNTSGRKLTSLFKWQVTRSVVGDDFSRNQKGGASTERNVQVTWTPVRLREVFSIVTST